MNKIYIEKRRSILFDRLHEVQIDCEITAEEREKSILCIEARLDELSKFADEMGIVLSAP